MTLSPRSLKRPCFITKDIFTKITAYLHLLTISYSDVKLTSAVALRADKSNPPHYDYVIGLTN